MRAALPQVHQPHMQIISIIAAEIQSFFTLIAINHKADFSLNHFQFIIIPSAMRMSTNIFAIY
jgi:hypothetical protein